MCIRSFVGVALVAAFALEANAGEPPVVPVGQPVKRQVTDYANFPGRTAAAESVEVRARVSGLFLKASFKEGSEVKQGDTLFEIDPRVYQAQYEQAVAQVKLHKASVRLASANLERLLAIVRAAPNAVSKGEVEQAREGVTEAEARLVAAEATLTVHKLNLDFTTVRSPINGRISRYDVTPGNLVTQDQTLLTTIVSIDPMYVYFDVDERTLLRMRRAVNAGKLKEPVEAATPVLMGLAGEEGFPHAGTISFVDNRVDAKTGTIMVRGVFPNPRPAGGVALMVPGMSVRVRLPLSAPYSAILLPANAVFSSKGQSFVNVVNAKDMIERRPVQLGSAQPGGLQVVDAGVTMDDWVVLESSSKLKEGLTVRPKKTQLPD
jgi:multidrug efflux system membrane fusion protein